MAAGRKSPRKVAEKGGVEPRSLAKNLRVEWDKELLKREDLAGKDVSLTSLSYVLINKFYVTTFLHFFSSSIIVLELVL